MRRVLLPLLAAALLLAATAPAALAAKPERFEDIVDPPPSSQNICGVDVTEDVFFRAHGITRADGSVVGSAQVRVTWTNAEGESLELFAANAFFAEPPIENPDGTITFVFRQAGVHERIRSSEGITAAFDRGQIIVMETVDFGDPEDPEDDELISQELTFHGPHPEAESNFELFCEVFTEVLG
jgi:hypothetical protein